MSLSKRAIEVATESGVGVAGTDVARLSRSGRVMTLRHVWRDGTDARIWGGVKRAAWHWAQLHADATRKSVEIYSAHGDMLDCVEPS